NQAVGDYGVGVAIRHRERTRIVLPGNRLARVARPVVAKNRLPGIAGQLANVFDESFGAHHGRYTTPRSLSRVSMRSSASVLPSPSLTYRLHSRSVVMRSPTQMVSMRSGSTAARITSRSSVVSSAA